MVFIHFVHREFRANIIVKVFYSLINRSNKDFMTQIVNNGTKYEDEQ